MDDVFIQQGTSNIYIDLGYEEPDVMKIKADIVSRIAKLMEEKNLTQQAVSELTGLSQGRISNILNGQFRGISEYRLLTCLLMLGQDIEIKITPSSEERGKIVFA